MTRSTSTRVATTQRVLTSSQVNRLDDLLKRLEAVADRTEAFIDDLEHRFNHDSGESA